jgi:hypothetical protein
MALYRKFGFIDLARTTRNGGSTIMAGGSAAGQILHL